MTRCVCGSESGGRARFCWGCGRQLTDLVDHDVLDLDDSDALVTVVRTGGWDRRYLLPLAGLLAVAALAMIWGTGQGEPVEHVEEAGNDAALPEPTTTTTTRPETTALNDTTTEGTERPRSTATQEVSTGFDGPFGYDLLVATTGRPARLDLDTGTVTYVEGTRVFPQFVWRSWLIVGSGSNVDLARLPLNDLGADPEPLLEAEGAVYSHVVSPVSRIIETGQLWISVTAGVTAGEPTETLHLVDIETGAVLDEREADPEGWRLANADREGLFTAPTGGIYQATGDTYRRVTDGRILASDSRRALVQTCNDELECRLRWLDGQSWEPLDLIVPEDQEAWYSMIPDTDWIFAPNFEAFAGPTSGELFNVATGEVMEVDLPQVTSSGISSLTPAVSPDGRWLATRGEDTKFLEFRDLASGDTVSIVLEDRIAGPIFFIDDAPQD